jgi:hypothetical protein
MSAAPATAKPGLPPIAPATYAGRRATEREHDAVQRIQSIVRGKRARGELSKLKGAHVELIHLYATQIQATFRGKKVRDARSGKVRLPPIAKRSREHAAQAIQARSRGHVARQKVSRERAEAAARKEEAAAAAREEAAAVRIQAMHRGAAARSVAGRRKLHLQRVTDEQAALEAGAACRIQARKRGATVRRDVASLRAERAEAARVAAALAAEEARVAAQIAAEEDAASASRR